MSACVRFLADEDFDNDIVRGVLRRLPSVDIVRVQDVGLNGRSDPEVLVWAAESRRVLLTHDVSTMTAHAIARIDKGLSMPGLFAVQQTASIGRVIEDIVLVAECSDAEEWDSRILYVPF